MATSKSTTASQTGPQSAMAAASPSAVPTSPKPLPMPTAVTLSGAAAAASQFHQSGAGSRLHAAAHGPGGRSSSAGGGGASGAGGGHGKKERWIVTRKTWRYMADAGKLLIPDALRKGKDMKEYSSRDYFDLDDHYQRLCNKQNEFVIWEGPLEDPRILLARNRITGAAAEVLNPLLLGKRRPPAGYEDDGGPTDKSVSTNAFDAAAAAAGGESLHDLQEGGLDATAEGGKAKRKKSKLGASGAAARRGRRRSTGTSGVGARSSSAVSATLEGVKGPPGGRHGFFPSPYGTGMVPTPGTALSSAATSTDPEISPPPPPSGKFRVMLPLGEAPPEGYVAVGKRTLPAGDMLLDYVAAQQQAHDRSPPSLVQLPGSGMILQELPASYAADLDRYSSSTRRSSSAVDSGVLSPDAMSPDERFEMFDPTGDMDYGRLAESGIGSGADSIGFAPHGARIVKDTVSVGVQTDALPDEFFELQEAERRAKEEEARLAREAEERKLRELEELEAAAMGDSVVRYLKMVRRNSKSSDAKKADRFRSMNYDPTLRNIKAKYLYKEDHIEGMQHAEVQCNESLLHLLRMCETPVEPNWLRDKLRLSNLLRTGLNETTAVETETRIPLDLPKDCVTAPKAPPGDFYASLYSGDVASGPLEPSSLSPEDYYAYLESWYRAQKGLHSQTAAFMEHQAVDGLAGGGGGGSGVGVGSDGRVAVPHGYQGRPLVLHEVSSAVGGGGGIGLGISTAATGGIPLLSSSAARRSAFAGGLPPPPRSTSTSTLTSSAGQHQHSGIYIPVSALENLRTSMPALASLAAAGPNVSRSTTSLDKSQSFLSSVISSARPFARSSGTSALGPAGAAASMASSAGAPGGHRMLGKKLWGGARPRSSSKSRGSSGHSHQTSSWTPTGNYRWRHATNRTVSLESTHILLLHEFERVALKKVALGKLNSSDLGFTARIPKETSDKSDSKLKRRKYLLKKRVIRKEKEDQSHRRGESGAVFGIPLSQCVSQHVHPAAATAAAASAGGSASSSASVAAAVSSGHGGSGGGGGLSLGLARRKRSTASDAPMSHAHRASYGSISDTYRSGIPASGHYIGVCGGGGGASGSTYTGAGSGGSSGGPYHSAGSGHSERVSSPQSTGSCESLMLDLAGGGYVYRRRSSTVGQSQESAVDAISYADAADVEANNAAAAQFLRVPPIVMACIRHLEKHGLRTVGIFRVSASKKRVRQLREDFDGGGNIAFCEDVAIHDVATLLKEFLRDLPEPLFPKDLLPGLLAVQKISTPAEQTLALQRILQLLPQVNRDTLFVLLHFLGLVADNSEDKAAFEEGSTDQPGNKMDATNLATIFAPNLLHTLPEDVAEKAAAAAAATSPTSPYGGSKGGGGGGGGGGAAFLSSTTSSFSAMATGSPERMEYVAAVRTLIERRDSIFELPEGELHDLYAHMWENCSDVLDVMLKRRLALAGQEIIEDDEEEENGDPSNLQSETCPGGASGGGSGGGTGPSWFRFGDKHSEHSDGGQSENSSTAGGGRWGFHINRRQRDRSQDPGGGGGGGGGGVGPSNLRFQVSHHPSQPGASSSRKSSTALSPDREAAPSHMAQSQVDSAAPPRRNAEMGRGTDSVVYSPAATVSSVSARGTPSSEMFFGSGNSTPSFVTSPPPNASAFSSPSFSPPVSPPPLMQVGPAAPAAGSRQAKTALGTIPGYEKAAPSGLVLQPAPASATGPNGGGLKKPAARSPQSFVTPPPPSADTEGGGADSSSTLTGGSGSGLSRRPYVRKRYTDTRHPTKELPDVRQDDSPPGDAGGLPTVQNPPASHRRQQQQDLKK